MSQIAHRHAGGRILAGTCFESNLGCGEKETPDAEHGGHVGINFRLPRGGPREQQDFACVKLMQMGKKVRRFGLAEVLSFGQFKHWNIDVLQHGHCFFESADSVT